ncbi:hypothetical protein CANMA_003614 [Candida margitis]|uniref:uncharacterized protein n=1 Tax=Candida margitis TaxID=1775924 RepID=UPI002226F430|nr:uncharacterized protein CANMA_003614 [Candida margitis]KAI5962839.1 hypothetical protein CANMA_003614 [Candida margitis]
MGKITRVRTGCWTCKKRHRKCDEAKPFCNNCKNTGRKCEGYELRLSFDFFQQGGGKKKKASHKTSPAVAEAEVKERWSKETMVKQVGEGPLMQPTNDPHYSTSAQNQNQPPNDSHYPLRVPNKPLQPTQADSSPTPVLGTASSSTNLNQFSSTLFEDLQSLLSSTMYDPLRESDVSPDSQISPSFYDFANFDLQIIDFMDKSQIFDANHRLLLDNFDSKSSSGTIPTAPPDTPSLFAMSHQEENMMLKHFFKKLLPLLDGHPKSPWPDLALQYCDFDIARSCFISLACIHMYESRAGGSELYQKGLAHINNTMDHLIHYIRENSNKMNNHHDANDAAIDTNKKYISYFVILVLMNVHVLFAVLEKGKSSIVREFFRIFAVICKDSIFYNQVLKTSHKKRSLAVVLSWYDTVGAIVTPDCREPFCSPQWYGRSNDDISTSKMMGCPGEIFVAMAEDVAYSRIRYSLVSYRDYVLTHEEDSNESYPNRLNCALCWSLAVWITLNRVVEPEDYLATNQKLASEFIHTYDNMDPKSSLVTQMVWPVYAIGCECKSDWERSNVIRFMENLYENTKMGTTASLKEIVQQVWERNITQEQYLTEWLGKNVDYLPV